VSREQQEQRITFRNPAAHCLPLTVLRPLPACADTQTGVPFDTTALPSTQDKLGIFARNKKFDYFSRQGKREFNHIEHINHKVKILFVPFAVNFLLGLIHR
jgi:hypothetical protein